MMFTPRIGVYICHCGINIAGTVDVEAVADDASRLPGVIISRHYTYMCSDPGQALIRQDIATLGLNRIVVASCSPLMHEPTFRAAIAEASLNPYCLEMANIREQCSWVHPQGVETTQKASQLVASAVAKAARLEPLEVRQAPVTSAALVIGGGVAGMQAALDIAQAGFEVTLVERLGQLGGHALQLHRTFPTLESVETLIRPLVKRVLHHPRIHVMTEAQVEAIGGYVGNFQASVRQDGGVVEIPVGVIVVATGFETYDPLKKPELGYGVYPQVITTLDFERMAAGDLSVNGVTPKKVVFIQCIGSRERSASGQEPRNSYCSRVCCMTVARQARLVRERLPDAQVTVFYMDVRAFGKGFEEFYDGVRHEGVVYRRGNPSEINRRGERVLVRAEDTLLGEPVEVEADLVVLAVGMTPQADSPQLSALLKLARSADGFFLEAHPKLRPVDTAMAGMFLAGACQGPKDISETIAHARAAAAAAIIPLMRGRVPVEAAVAYVDEAMCSGCNQCAQICSYSALQLHPLRGVMVVNPVLCQGCSACATTCPSGAINVHHFTFEQVMAQIDALSEPVPQPVLVVGGEP
jgi:heterodisulfide reductase subunit A